MDKSFLAEREKFLKEILTDLKSKLEKLTTLKIESGDELDICSQEKEHSNVLKFRRRTQNYLTKVTKSLKKVEGGTYGVCEDCGSDIELGRLKARPTATMCITCKEEQEHDENQTAQIIPFKRPQEVWEKVAR